MAMESFRMTRRGLARALIAVLAASGVVAAFATMAPSPDESFAAGAPLVEALSPRTDGVVLPPNSYRREERFQRGDTLAGFLLRLGIAEPHVDKLKRQRALQQLKPGMLVAAEVGADGAPLYLSFLSGRDVVRIGGPAEGYRASTEAAEFEARTVTKAGLIRSSLFAATDAADIPDSVAMQLADVFGGDIDFHRDLRKGDRFEVAYELYHFSGRPVRAGRVLAAQFTNQGKTFRAVYYKGGYYAEDGQNLRKQFLRSPLEFSRISSGFGMRHHPLHKTWMAHKGVDYAAPIGTRVRAAGDGFVEFAGQKGGYGNVVILRHSGQYSTVYAHLSRIAVRRGQRVEQNDTIGFVGQTGWATGPHLHYEFRVAGQARNPLSIAMPAAAPVPAQDLPEFLARVRPLVAQLELMANGGLAQAE